MSFFLNDDEKNEDIKRRKEGREKKNKEDSLLSLSCVRPAACSLPFDSKAYDVSEHTREENARGAGTVATLHTEREPGAHSWRLAQEKKSRSNKTKAKLDLSHSLSLSFSILLHFSRPRPSRRWPRPRSPRSSAARSSTLGERNFFLSKGREFFSFLKTFFLIIQNLTFFLFRRPKKTLSLQRQPHRRGRRPHPQGRLHRRRPLGRLDRNLRGRRAPRRRQRVHG